MRSIIHSLVQSIVPADEAEAEQQSQALAWIRSGAELFRREKPATPSPHLVVYFVVVDPHEKRILLVDHKNAGLWLPTGGHVDPDEHPRAAVAREAAEELSLTADFLLEEPLFVTVAETVGRTAGHTDVTLWFALRGDSKRRLTFDPEEFLDARWFPLEDPPGERIEPNLERFLRKLRPRLST